MRSIALIVLIFSEVRIATGDTKHISFSKEEPGSISDSWDKWWSYGGISGPRYWASYSNWRMCGQGKQQSPINIQPELLLYDPNLEDVVLNVTTADGQLVNTGNDITFYFTNDVTYQINVTGGPLPYMYTITDIKFHFGKGDYSQSEHTINNRTFPAEIQLRGYNREVYGRFDQAEISVRGMVIIAVFIEIGEHNNEAFEIISKHLQFIPKRGNTTYINSLPVTNLVANTEEYMTYEGSLTQPGCHESVTWIIINKPIYVTKEQMNTFQNGAKMEWRRNNARPLNPLNQRVIRTNINMKSKSSLCNVEKQYHYQVNGIFNS